MGVHTYRKKDGFWETGFAMDDHWVALRKFKYEESAAAFANYLNGGDGRIFPLPIGQG